MWVKTQKSYVQLNGELGNDKQEVQRQYIIDMAPFPSFWKQQIDENTFPKETNLLVQWYPCEVSPKPPQKNTDKK